VCSFHGTAVEFTGVHHVGLLCENTERSLEFYCGLLGMCIAQFLCLPSVSVFDDHLYDFHISLACSKLPWSLEVKLKETFWCYMTGLEINPTRPNDKLPYGGKWLNVGSQMIHLMELPNPDPKTGRPKHGGRDRHACVAIKDVSKLKAVFDKAGRFNN
jgi:glyoxylase I family protein